MTSFLNSEVVLSIVQSVEMQVKAYTEFCKHFDDDKDEARKQTEIFMKAMFGCREKTDEVK